MLQPSEGGDFFIWWLLMNEIKIFQREEFGRIRTAGTSDEPLFCLADICRAVELTNPSSVKARLDPDDTQLVDLHALSDCEGEHVGNSMATFVTESGFYDVVLYSSSEKVRPFKRWVTKDVLPSIRQTGSYGLPKTFAEALRLAADQQEKIEAQDRIIREQAPKADYFDNLVERNLLTNFRDTAKQIGLKQNDFIKRLIRDKYIYRDKKNMIKPYSKYVGELFEIKDWGGDGKAGSQTLITPKGKETFKLLYSDIFR